jgi:hypothetical protein
MTVIGIHTGKHESFHNFGVYFGDTNGLLKIFGEKEFKFFYMNILQEIEEPFELYQEYE